MQITGKAFIFSRSYRLQRHVVFWIVHVLIWAAFWTLTFPSFSTNLLRMLLWAPVKILYCYPFMYFIIPRFLFKEKYLPFATIILAWGVAGWLLNFLAMAYWIMPMMDTLGRPMNITPWNATSYLCLTTAAASTVVVKVCIYWV